MYPRKLISAVLITFGGLSSPLAQACDMHGGFGFSPFAQFPAHAQPRESSKVFRAVSLYHEEQVEVTSGNATETSVDYRIAPTMRNVKLSFTSDPEIKLESESSLSPSDYSGSFNLKYRAAKPGVYFINIQIDALDGLRPVSKMKTIEVRAV